MKISIIGSSIQRLRQKFSQSTGLPIRETLSEDEIEEAALKAEDVTYRRCLFDPILTIWAFLSQVLDADRSCRKAISRVYAYLSDTQKQRIDPMELIDSQADTGPRRTPGQTTVIPGCVKASLSPCGHSSGRRRHARTTLVGSSRVPGRWDDGVDAGYARKSGGLSSTSQPEGRLRFPYGQTGCDFLLNHRGAD